MILFLISEYALSSFRGIAILIIVFVILFKKLYFMNKKLFFFLTSAGLIFAMDHSTDRATSFGIEKNEYYAVIPKKNGTEEKLFFASLAQIEEAKRVACSINSYYSQFTHDDLIQAVLPSWPADKFPFTWFAVTYVLKKVIDLEKKTGKDIIHQETFFDTVFYLGKNHPEHTALYFFFTSASKKRLEKCLLLVSKESFDRFHTVFADLELDDLYRQRVEDFFADLKAQRSGQKT